MRCEHGRLWTACPELHSAEGVTAARAARATGAHTFLDLSNHDESTFDAQCLKDSGVTDVIMGCQLGGAPARRMIPKLQQVGIRVRGTYAFLGFRDWWIQPTNHAIAVAQQFGLPKVWLDAEADDANTGQVVPGVTPSMRIARLMEACNLVQVSGLARGIYSAKWFWVPYMANSLLFANEDLWLGGPYGVPPISGAPGFGGWQKVAIHQHTSTAWVCGRGRDANYDFEEDSDMGMTPEEKARFDNLEKLASDLANIVVRNGIDLTGDGEVDLVGDAALAHAVAGGWSAFLGIGQAKQKIADHIENHPGGDSGSVVIGTFEGKIQ